MNQHKIRQLQQFLQRCEAEGVDPFVGPSQEAEAAREARRGMRLQEPTVGDYASEVGYSGPAEYASVSEHFGLETPEVKAMSYAERSERGIPVCDRDRTGRCRVCQHQGPCRYQRWVGGTRATTMGRRH